jgi:hypothetical protein
MELTIYQEEFFEPFIEELKSIITEGVFRSRAELIEAYHKLGTRILEENDSFERHKIYGEKITQCVAKSLGKSERTIQYAIRFAKLYPVPTEKVIDQLPDGKNTSWHKITQKLLTTPKEECQHEWTEISMFQCQKCGKTRKN